MHPEHPADELFDIEAVQLINQAYYDAFEANDFEALAALWEQTERIQCTHPGWSVLRGWSEVGASFKAMIEGPSSIQFVLTNQRVEIQGDVAWVTVDENIIGDGPHTTVTALNMFSRDPLGGWRFIGHHGAPIMMR